MSSLDAVLKQYEQGQVQNNSPKTNISREDRLKKYKTLLKFKNITFEADLFTWHNEDL